MSLEVDSLADELNRLGAGTFQGSERAALDDWQVMDLKPDRTFDAQLQFVTTVRQKTPAG